MAGKKTAMMKAGTAALETMEPWEIELQKSAKEDAAKETLGVARITHKGSVLKLDGKKVEGNRLSLAIIDYAFAKAYFDAEYEEGAHATPVCYAFGKDEASLAPHPQAPKPQVEAGQTCAGCKHNAFGTALKGKGKACKDERRVAVVLPANSEPDSILEAEKRQFSVPPASLKGWGGYVKRLKDITPTGSVNSVMTILSAEGRDAGGYELTFEPGEVLPKAAVKALFDLRPSVQEELTAPYPNVEGAAEPAVDAAKAKKLRSKTR